MNEFSFSDVLPDGVLCVDETGRIVHANPALEQLAGYSDEMLFGQHASILFRDFSQGDQFTLLGKCESDPLEQSLNAIEMTLLRRDGTLLAVESSIAFWVKESERFAVICVRDISKRKAYQDELQYEATHDALTKLPNRWLLTNRLESAIAQARRRGRLVALMLIDLDGFKLVNDTLGHEGGDELLVEVGRRLAAAIRENDTLARIGGDEFVVMLSDLESEDEAVAVAKKILEVFKRPCVIRKQLVAVGSSIGISLYPTDTQESNNLLRFADLAMYKAKRNGGTAYACYSNELDQRVQEELSIQMHLRDAISYGKLQLRYQPQIDLRSDQINGAEALIRWSDDIYGDVPPSKFMPVAESTGLIVPLFEWALTSACKLIASWNADGMPLRVAVNLSVQQLRRSNFANEVKAILEQTGADPRLLEFEIKGSAFLDLPIVTIDLIKKLRGIGCSIAVDQFGAGHFSFWHLKELRGCTLKIDKNIVQGLCLNKDDVLVAKSVIALANYFDLNTVAVGVETPIQLDILRELGCDSYQGWLFSKELDPTDFTQIQNFSSKSRWVKVPNDAYGASTMSEPLDCRYS